MSGAFPDPLVVHTDSDGDHLLVSFRSGPAGVAELDTGEGVWISVDFADPATLASIRVEPGVDPQLLGELIGEDRAAAVVSMAATPSGRPRRLAGETSPNRSARRRPVIDRFSTQDREAEPTTASHAAISASIAGDPTRSSLARAAAHLEVFELATGGIGAAPLRRLADRSIDDAARHLEDAGTEIETLATLDVGTAKRLASMCAGARDASPTISRAIDRLLSHARRDPAVDLLQEERSPDPDGSTSLLVDLRPAGRLVARCGDGEGRWMRVVHARSLVLLAIVPMRRDGSSWRADALVPPDLGPADVAVDLTTEPLPIGASSLHRVQRAVRLGRRAVDAHVTGHHDRSRRWWTECALAWRELRDDARATIAERFASGEYDPRRSATLSERVDAVLRSA